MDWIEAGKETSRTWSRGGCGDDDMNRVSAQCSHSRCVSLDTHPQSPCTHYPPAVEVLQVEILVDLTPEKYKVPRTCTSGQGGSSREDGRPPPCATWVEGSVCGRLGCAGPCAFWGGGVQVFNWEGSCVPVHGAVHIQPRASPGGTRAGSLLSH